MRFSSNELLAPVQDTRTERRFHLSGDVLFDFDKDAIRVEAEPVLAGLAERIRAEFPGATVRIEGHTDAIGSNRYNQALSLRRAESIENWFERKGGLTSPMSARGLGESQPAQPNTLPDGSDNLLGRQHNRRVEIIVEK